MSSGMSRINDSFHGFVSPQPTTHPSTHRLYEETKSVFFISSYNVIVTWHTQVTLAFILLTCDASARAPPPSMPNTPCPAAGSYTMCALDACQINISTTISASAIGMMAIVPGPPSMPWHLGRFINMPIFWTTTTSDCHRRLDMTKRDSRRHRSPYHCFDTTRKASSSSSDPRQQQ
ncbi:hypothetical protein BDZ97DRAFT_1920752 [Flammula alnicola]|nr:hypothetical protein BDZ97DRAFT_1920752 [Flammula alnicola]